MDTWKIFPDGDVIVEETTRLAGLTIRKGTSLRAPEGKNLTLTVDGIQVDPLPGQYQGDLVLTVSDSTPVAYRELTHDFRAALLVENGEVSDKSVAAARLGGTLTPGCADGLTVDSRGEAFNCVYITGDGEYTIRNADLRASGTGGNDFCGWGSALTTHGTAKVLVENSSIETFGAARNAVVVAGSSEVTFRDCVLSSRDGVLPADYEDTIALGVMKAVPWMLGLRGNCRTTNLCGNGQVTYERCRISAGGWGVLSVDDLENGRLVVKDSVIEVTGPSGYGSFSIGNVEEIFDHTTIRVPDFGLIGAMGTQYYTNGTCIEAGRNALTSATGGTLKADKGCVFHSGMTTIANKGGACQFLLEDCELISDNGILFQTEISDDPRGPKNHYIDPPEEDVRDESLDIFTFAKGEDTLLSLTRMQVKGNVFNGSTNQKADTGGGMPPMGPMPSEGAPEGMPDGMPGQGPGPEGAPGDGPEGGKAPGGMPGKSGKQGARNLKLLLNASKLEGIVSASISRHRVEKITKENCGEIGIFVDRAAPAVNNGVLVELDGSSEWIVTGECFLTRLSFVDGASVCAAEGRQLHLFVDGVEIPCVPGDYRGALRITVD